ncbi:hypothetical protein KGEDBEEJ_00636 [Aeromonas hydrophila]|nr:hypothetical protein KBAHV27_39040 [Aeromonas hydrophila]CAD7555639.1 hypothetical protein KBAHV46_39090 [Aeromonas hydrophila]CAD7555652.1 hypothetical protein KBAHV42_39130 [Aeromonas hydrophila]CAD7556598.1 hypothetical protein KBAHV01_39000 [Aeromonas hydrophila]CAD7556857.1 hypothetical protein KBAHV22_39190 [Aeromonas hydrophila]
MAGETTPHSYQINYSSWAGYLPLSPPAQSPLNCARQTAQIAHFSAHWSCAKSKHNGEPILEELGVASAGEVMRGLEIAQLRRTAQNEIHRREEQLGEYETGM